MGGEASRVLVPLVFSSSSSSDLRQGGSWLSVPGRAWHPQTPKTPQCFEKWEAGNGAHVPGGRCLLLLPETLPRTPGDGTGIPYPASTSPSRSRR